MATSSNTYGTSTGIERLVGDIVLSRTFTTTTVPTSAQVDLFLDQTAADLNVTLAGAGYTAPVSTSSDPITHRWLESVNEMGAAALILGSIPMTAIAPGVEDAGSNRMEMFQAQFNRALTRIEEQKISAARGRSRLGAVFSGSQEDTDGNRKLPIFKRGADKTPGTRPLTEG